MGVFLKLHDCHFIFIFFYKSKMKAFSKLSRRQIDNLSLNVLFFFFTDLAFVSPLTCMCLGCGKKPENPEGPLLEITIN